MTDYEYVVFSSDFSEEYTVERLHKMGVPFKQLVGCYKGVMETSFIVPYEHWYYIDHMAELQESILMLTYVDARNRRDAYLVYGVPGMDEYLGKMHSVGHSYAIQQDAWSYDPSTNTYYVAEEM